MELYFNKLKQEIESIWWELPTGYGKYEIKYNIRKDRSLKEINANLADYINSNDAKKNDEMLNLARNFAVNSLDISSSSVDILCNEEYFKYSKEFVSKAKELDDTLSLTGISQALRNVWTMHSMQIYLNKKVELTDSVFAYSMLYPLTDNYLDNPSLTKSEKIDFNNRFRVKISTGVGCPLSNEEAKIYKMIDLIENQWNRNKYPKVFESLLAILDGQTLSLNQQHLDSIYIHDILGISIYKGGASVLADAYLIAGNLSSSDEKYAFYYGVILQLADDLQDIREDLKNNHYTVMNIQSKFGNLDSIFQKYLNFIDYFLEEVYEIESDSQVALKELTSESIRILIFSAILKNKKLVSKKLFNSVKAGSNFSPKVYRKTERNFNKQLQTLVVKYL